MASTYIEFSGSANMTKTFTEDKFGFSITNDGTPNVDPSLSFTINGLTYTVKAGESYSGGFSAFRQVDINTTLVPFRARVLDYLNMTGGGITSLEYETSPNLVNDQVTPIVTATPNGGTFPKNQMVKLKSNKDNSLIYYTINDMTPTEQSAIYSSPIEINKNTTIKYFARDSFGNTSAPQEVSFVINIPDVTPAVSTGLVSKYNLSALRGGNVVVDPISGKNMTIVNFNTLDFVGDGVKGNTIGTIFSPNLLNVLGSFTVFATFKWSRKPLGVFGGHQNLLSLTPDLNIATPFSDFYSFNAGVNSIWFNSLTTSPYQVFPTKPDTVCLKYDHSVNKATFYLNGQEIVQSAYTLTSIPVLTLFGGNYTVGTNGRGSHIFTNALFYDGTLTNAEITSVYDSIKREMDIYDTTNYLTNVDNGLLEAYDLASVSNPIHNSLVGYGALNNINNSSITVGTDGGMVNGEFKAEYDQFKGVSGTYILRAKVLNSTIYSNICSSHNAILRQQSNGTIILRLNEIGDYAPISIPDAKMHTYAFTMDEVGTDCIIKGYRDGILITTVASTISNITDKTKDRRKDRSMTEVFPNTNTQKFAILNYSRALTSSEIAQVHSDLVKWR
jgi:hypothetical protein